MRPNEPRRRVAAVFVFRAFCVVFQLGEKTGQLLEVAEKSRLFERFRRERGVGRAEKKATVAILVFDRRVKRDRFVVRNDERSVSLFFQKAENRRRSGVGGVKVARVCAV